MSISTKRGDEGDTDLMYGRRVAKTHPRVAAVGALDELNAALGLVRATTSDEDRVAATVGAVQEDLVVMMGELSVDDADRDRYAKQGFRFVDAGMVERLDKLVVGMEEEFEIRFRGWATPGAEANLPSAHLDLARTVCRRGERSVWTLHSKAPLPNGQVARYLNRLSDVLWLLARYEDCLARKKG